MERTFSRYLDNPNLIFTRNGEIITAIQSFGHDGTDRRIVESSGQSVPEAYLKLVQEMGFARNVQYRGFAIKELDRKGLELGIDLKIIGIDRKFTGMIDSFTSYTDAVIKIIHQAALIACE